jgi:hypothetical protein
VQSVREAETPKFRANIGGRSYLWEIDTGALKIYNEEGEELNPSSAQVLLSLGGQEPEWLAPVEALTEAFRVPPHGSPADAVSAAANALSQNQGRRAEIARTTEDEAVLAALAAIGTTQVGQNPYCKPRAWELLMNSRDPSTRQKALRTNEVLPPLLWQYPDPNTRIRVARNIECPAAILAELAKHNPDAPQVRAAVASNTGTPDVVLRELALDSDMSVRRAVGSNLKCPLGSFSRLSQDRFAPVRVSVISNPSIPTNLIARRIRIDPTPSVHVALASRVDLSARSLGWLERYSRSDPVAQYRLVCSRISDHPRCTAKMARHITKVESRLNALSSDDISALDQSRRGRSGRRLAPGILPLLLLLATALAIGCALIGAGIEQVSSSPVAQGIGFILAGAVVGIGLLVLAFALYRRLPIRGLVAPPRPRGLVQYLVAIGLLVLANIHGSSKAASYLRPILLIAIALVVGHAIRRKIRSSRVSVPSSS